MTIMGQAFTIKNPIRLLATTAWGLDTRAG